MKIFTLCPVLIFILLYQTHLFAQLVNPAGFIVNGEEELLSSQSAILDCSMAPLLACGVEGSISNAFSASSDIYSCSAQSYLGPEIVFTIEVYDNQVPVVIRLKDLTVDLDMFLLSACDGNTCLESSTNAGLTDELISTTSLAPGFYYLVVDGANGVVGDFTISYESCGLPPVDGCNDIVPLSCGESRNDVFDSFISVAGCGRNSYGQFYSFTAPLAGTFTVNLSAANGSTFILLGDATMCLLNNCNVINNNISTDPDKSMEFSALAGEQFTIIIESTINQQIPYTVDLECDMTACGNARSIDCGLNSFGDNTGLLYEFQLPGCLPVSDGDDLTAYVELLEFVAPVSGTIDIQLTNLTANLDLFVLDGVPCDNNCLAGSSNSGLSDEFININLTSGQTYHIAVRGWNQAQGSFTLFVDCNEPVACDNTLPITCQQSINGDLTGLFQEFELPMDCLIPINQVDDDVFTAYVQVYEFVPPLTGNINIQLTNLTADLDLFFFDGTPCDDNCLATSHKYNLNAEFINSAFVLASQTYYIAVRGKFRAQGSYTLKLDCNLPLACENPISINCGQSVNGNNNGAYIEVSPALSCEAGIGDGDSLAVFGNLYAFTPEFSGDFTVSMTGLNADLDLILYENADCDAACIASSWNLGTNSEEISRMFTAGTLYYILVRGYQRAQSSYNLSVNCFPEACDNTIPISCGAVISGDNSGVFQQFQLPQDCEIMMPISSDGDNFTSYTQVYEFIPPVSGNVTIQLTDLSANLDLFIMSGMSCDDNCNGGSVNSGLNDELLDRNLTAGQTYYIVVRGWNLAQGTYTLSLDCNLPVACANIVPIVCGDVFNGDNTGVFQEFQYPGCFGLEFLDDEFVAFVQVYEFIPELSSVDSFTLENFSVDLDLLLYDGTPCDDNCIAQSSNLGNTPETVIRYLTAGQSYYIAVRGYDRAQSSYTLSVECELVACNNALPVSCGDVVNGDNTGAWQFYLNSCGFSDSTVDSAFVQVYEFVATSTVDITVELSNLVVDLDLVLNTGTPCDQNCDMSSLNGGTTDESLAISVVAGNSYYLAVRGWSQAQGSYTLSFNCPDDCGNDIILTSPVDDINNQSAVYETDQSITTDNIITGSSIVVYDAGICIQLNGGFEVGQGVEFDALIDGCNVVLKESESLKVESRKVGPLD